MAASEQATSNEAVSPEKSKVAAEIPDINTLTNKKIALIATIVSLVLATMLTLAIVVIIRQNPVATPTKTSEIEILDNLVEQIQESSYSENLLDNITPESSNTENSDKIKTIDEELAELDAIDFDALENEYAPNTLENVK